MSSFFGIFLLVYTKTEKSKNAITYFYKQNTIQKETKTNRTRTKGNNVHTMETLWKTSVGGRWVRAFGRRNSPVFARLRRVFCASPLCGTPPAHHVPSPPFYSPFGTPAVWHFPLHFPSRFTLRLLIPRSLVFQKDNIFTL